MQHQDQQESAGTRYAGLQINEDINFKRKEWAFERLGWVLMALLVVTALAGLFSSGPLSQKKISDPAGGLQIQYERFQRLHSSGIMKIDILSAAGTGNAGILLQGDIIRNFETETIRPDPANIALTENGWRMEFPVSATPASIRLTAKPWKIGLTKGRIALEGHDPVEISIFVYP